MSKGEITERWEDEMPNVISADDLRKWKAELEQKDKQVQTNNDWFIKELEKMREQVPDYRKYVYGTWGNEERDNEMEQIDLNVEQMRMVVENQRELIEQQQRLIEMLTEMLEDMRHPTMLNIDKDGGVTKV